MYSCEKCKKWVNWIWRMFISYKECLEVKWLPIFFIFFHVRLRNGVKFCKMQSLPEVCIQIKYFMARNYSTFCNVFTDFCIRPSVCVSRQILCIHLKRFRHELMFSTKIGTHVSFPLEGLDLQPFLAKDSSAQTSNYDLLSVICHHGTASSEWADLPSVWHTRVSCIH